MSRKQQLWDSAELSWFPISGNFGSGLLRRGSFEKLILEFGRVCANAAQDHCSIT